MKLTHMLALRLMKLFFSLTILELLAVCLLLERSPFVPELLEYPAMCLVLALLGGFLLEYVIHSESR